MRERESCSDSSSINPSENQRAFIIILGVFSKKYKNKKVFTTM